MLLAIVAAAVTIASKIGSFVTGASAIGPIVHQLIVGAFNASNASSKVLSLSAGEQSCATVSKDEQSCVAETLVEDSESNEIQNVSRAMVQYNKPSSNVVVMNLSIEPTGKSFFDTLVKEELSSAMVIFMTLAAWYRSRIFIMLQSTFHLLVGAEHCTNQKKEFTEATRVIQMKIYLLVASAINRWKEIIHSLLGPLLLFGAEAQLHCSQSTAETALTSVLQLLTMLFAATNGVFHAIQMKICLLVASATNRWKEIIDSRTVSTHLGPLPPSVEQRLCGISATGTALISAMQHLAVLFAVAKRVLLEYKSSRPHLPGMKQFVSMFLVLGLLTMSGSCRVHSIISRSSIISSYDTDGLEDLMGLAASSSAVSGLSGASFQPAVLFNDDHLSTEPTRSSLLDTQSLSTAFASNEDLMALNAVLDEDDQSLCMSDWSGYNNGPVFLPQTDLDDVASTALSLDWDTSDRIHFARSTLACRTAHSSLIMICTLDLASDRVDVVTFRGFVLEYYFAVVVVKQIDVYTVSAIIVVDSRIVYSFDPHDLFELPTYPRLSSGGDEEASNTPMLVELGTSEEVIPYFSESNDSFRKALPVQLQDCIGSSSVASHQSWDSTSYKVSASAKTEVISSALVHQPNIDPFTLVRWRLRSASTSSLLKAFDIFNTWELHQLVFMVLLIVVCRDSDTNTDHPEEVHSTSNSLHTNSQDTLELENEASFDNQQDGAEESLTPATHKHKQAVSRESTALLSDLGRHWNSPPKRRCRRSPRKRRKPTRYQPV